MREGGEAKRRDSGAAGASGDGGGGGGCAADRDENCADEETTVGDVDSAPGGETETSPRENATEEAESRGDGQNGRRRRLDFSGCWRSGGRLGICGGGGRESRRRGGSVGPSRGSRQGRGGDAIYGGGRGGGKLEGLHGKERHARVEVPVGDSSDNQGEEGGKEEGWEEEEHGEKEEEEQAGSAVESDSGSPGDVVEATSTFCARICMHPTNFVAGSDCYLYLRGKI